MNVDVEEQIRKIIINELNLPLDYGKDKEGFIIPSCYVYAPNISIGNTDKLQICIQSINSRVLANNNSYKQIESNFTEIQEAAISDTIQIDLYSRNEDAKTRRFEVLTALHSLYAQQLQEQYHFKIFQIPNNINNTSIIEGAARLYRYTFTITTVYKRQYNKLAEYFDKFRFEHSIDTLENKTEFEIPEK